MDVWILESVNQSLKTLAYYWTVNVVFTIVMGGLVKQLASEEDAPMQWHTQAGNITTGL